MARRIYILVLLLALAVPDGAFCWETRVLGVSDGDTIKIMSGWRAEKVRLYGVDCPEHGQDFGSQAKRFTSRMVFGKVVEVEPVDQDQYGRIVAWVSVDGKSLNRELLRAGMAWWYRRHAWTDFELGRLEKEARRNRVGLWSHPDPVPPWKFRRNKMNGPGRTMMVPSNEVLAFGSAGRVPVPIRAYPAGPTLTAISMLQWRVENFQRPELRRDHGTKDGLWLCFLREIRARHYLKQHKKATTTL